MMDDVILSVVPKQKYLGLIFDERLTWYYHVSKVCKSMSYYLHLLCKHRHVLTDDFLKTLAESLVFSHLIYCLPVWGPSLPHCSFERIKRMQNRAVCLCRCLHKYDHVSHHYHSLNWLPFELLVRYRSLCALHRMFKYQRLPLDPVVNTPTILELLQFLLSRCDIDCLLHKNILDVSQLCGGMLYLRKW